MERGRSARMKRKTKKHNTIKPKKMETNSTVPQPENQETFENPATTETPSTPTIESTPACQSADTAKSCQCSNKLLLVLNIVLLLAVAFLCVCHFTGIGAPNGKSKANPAATEAVVPQDGVLKVAYVNSDTLLAKYK